MERGGRFHRYRRHAKNSASSAPPSGTGAPQEIAPNNSAAGSSNNGGAPAAEAAEMEQAPNLESPPPAARGSPCVAREQDQYMPIANVIRIMRRILPAHAKISDDAKETIQECVSEFISFITGEANDRCQKEQRKTITAEDILWSMGKLGFDEYVEPLTLFLNRYRESESDRSSSRDSILRRSSAAARAADFGMNNCVFPPPPLHFGAAYPMLPPQPLNFAAPQNLFDGGMVGGFYKDPTEFDAAGGGNFGGAGNNPNPNQLFPYDPFSQFK